MTTDELRTRYKELKARADESYKAAEPQRAALYEAETPHRLLSEKIDDLLDGAEVDFCESCLEPIFDGDKWNSGFDGRVCEACAPSYRNILDGPEHFLTFNDEQMTADKARSICDAHVAAGGSLDDKMVD